MRPAGGWADILRNVWGGSGTRAGARAQSVLMSGWRTCWQQGRSATNFLSQLLRGPPSQGRATRGIHVRQADAAVALESRNRPPHLPERRPLLYWPLP